MDIELLKNKFEDKRELLETRFKWQEGFMKRFDMLDKEIRDYLQSITPDLQAMHSIAKNISKLIGRAFFINNVFTVTFKGCNIYSVWFGFDSENSLNPRADYNRDHILVYSDKKSSDQQLQEIFEVYKALKETYKEKIDKKIESIYEILARYLDDTKGSLPKLDEIKLPIE